MSNLIPADEIVELLKADANRRALSGDKRGARILRNALKLVYSAKPKMPTQITVPSVLSEFDGTTDAAFEDPE